MLYAVGDSVGPAGEAWEGAEGPKKGPFGPPQKVVILGSAGGSFSKNPSVSADLSKKSKNQKNAF